MIILPYESGWKWCSKMLCQSTEWRSPWYSTWLGSDQKISPPMKSRCDSCHRRQDSHSGWMDNVVGLRILAAGELEVTLVTHRGFPFCFAARAIGSPVNRRLSASCHVALPFHHVAVTPYRCLINAGEVATTVDTNSQSRWSSLSPATRTAWLNSAPPLKSPINWWLEQLR
jgi:hypothetical protein